ncbi:hypothetical protein DERP_015027 [Dermatophagoides pteronyssinus]|uniref:FLYWCH-type domain-containing protein n=1 Tax=Dermatophagoides pteronyssinus TaxID=6956 RepID=A0ABQ8JCV5_DERPT|nr:hypothetical protein DERP_015027 [Dermatophagoides pteronyssinus]
MENKKDNERYWRYKTQKHSMLIDNHNGKYHLGCCSGAIRLKEFFLLKNRSITATTTTHNHNQNFIYNLASRISHNG